MRNKLFSVLSVLALSLVSLGQSSTPNPSTSSSTFTISASVLSLPAAQQTNAATDIGQTFAVTPKFLLRADEILAPSVNLDSYFGGIQYSLPTAKILTKTNLDPAHFQFYVVGSLGQARVTVQGVPTATHFASLAGGGVNYDPSGTGKFKVNLIEVRYARLPGLANSTVVASSGLNIGF
jgi:hypothetical protein